MRKVALPSNLDYYNFGELSKKTSEHTLLRRLLALHNLQMGNTVLQTANNLAVSSRMVHRWINQYRDFGLDGLKDKPGRGRKNILSKEDLQKLKKILIKMENVKAITLKEILFKDFNLKSTIPTCYRILRELQIKYDNHKKI